ncbi:TPA: hypothetical protein VJE30_001330 [Streptococcus pyogenes]|nr:hypothetical protein [Streptococcus pyogenes]
MSQKNRITIYLNDNNYQKFEEVIGYLLGSDIYLKSNKSSIMIALIETFHRLFILPNEQLNYSERLAQLEKIKDSQISQLESELKVIKRQLDQLNYLELTNFHAITKGAQFDVQELESIYSKIDPQQHELMARIDELVREDKERGQTIKYSH